MKTVLGIDIGYGDVKVTFGTTDGHIDKQFKFTSTIGITQRNEHVSDKRIYDFKGHAYYVGENALHLPSDNLIDITDYKNLEYYAPLFLHHAIKQIGSHPDIIVSDWETTPVGCLLSELECEIKERLFQREL